MGSGNIFYVLLLVAVIVLIICAALQFGEVTVNKGHPEKKTMIIALCLLIPPAGYLLACALPDNTLREMIMRSTGNGADNRAGESVCHCCGSSLPAMENADISKLRERCAARLEDERKAAAKAAEDRRIASEKAAKKTKRILSIAIPAVITVIAIVLVVTKIVIPNSNYNAAVELYDEGKYREAAAAFLALGDYKDSQARCFSVWGEITERQTISAGYYFTVAVKNDGTVVAGGIMNMVNVMCRIGLI